MALEKESFDKSSDEEGQYQILVTLWMQQRCRYRCRSYQESREQDLNLLPAVHSGVFDFLGVLTATAVSDPFESCQKRRRWVSESPGFSTSCFDHSAFNGRQLTGKYVMDGVRRVSFGRG